MKPGWQEEIDEAQALTGLMVCGVEYKRLHYGSEPREGSVEPHRICHDCLAPMGQLHVPGCDMEACPRCSRQIISCDCELTHMIFECGCIEEIPDDELEVQ